MTVRRYFAEKKSGFDLQAKRLLNDFNDYLGTNLADLRLLIRYDAQGLTDEDAERAKTAVFCDPACDICYEETYVPPEGYDVFAVEYLPGQFDSRANSAAECVQLLTQKERPAVKSAEVYAVKGANKEELDRIKKYVINPVDSREASLEKPETLELTDVTARPIEKISGFRNMDEGDLRTFLRENGFAMDIADILCAQEYFASEQRDPTMTELKILDTYWSDHCRHTTFLTELTDVSFADDPISKACGHAYERYLDERRAIGDKKDVCLMDLATIYMRGQKARGHLREVVVSGEVNACTVKKQIPVNNGEEDWLILFKNETHNHPTEIEPFGGAATCLGGAIRDPLSGRAYVHHAMRVTGSADPREAIEDTLAHKLPQRKITTEAAGGFSSYGNQIGIPTGWVEEIYHPGYKAKRLEIGAVVGAAKEADVIREEPQPGDAVLLIGGATGRDGIGGATGSSMAHNSRSADECGAQVQKGNPAEERKLQRLFSDPEFTRLVRRCNDFGAGGVCVAVGELADGLFIDLSAVPKKYEGLDGTELAISESQERMAVAVAESDVKKAVELARKENLNATQIARVTDNGRLVFTWNGEIIADLSREFLNSNGAKRTAKAFVSNEPANDLLCEEVLADPKETLLHLMSDLNICSQKGLIEMFDATVGAKSVTLPLGGRKQLTPVQAMAAIVGGDGSKTVTLMSMGADPYVAERSPYLGAVYAALLSAAKNAAAGGDLYNAYFTFQEYFEKPGDDPARWGQPLGALLGAFSAQNELHIAGVGGKDSMSGSYNDLDVPPTFVSFCVSTADADEVLTPEFKRQDSKLYLLEIERSPDGVPDLIDARLKYKVLREYLKQGKIRSAYALGRGGVLACAAKCALGNNIGVNLYESDLSRITRKNYGDILVEADEISDGDFSFIGETTKTSEIKFAGARVPLSEVKEAYTAPLQSVFPSELPPDPAPIETPVTTERGKTRSSFKTAVPKVVIPIFPGTNCETESAAAFERAGAVSSLVHVNNLTPQMIDESVRHLASEIANAQILMIPGGFSGADEPDGSGKFIAAVFRNARLIEAVSELLEDRDGIVLGICNGFQALLRLGLLPFGKILPRGEDALSLTFNRIGRHVCTVARTRITSVKSPWLTLCEPGEIHSVSVSHGEGRFAASERALKELTANGQIATQYTDDNGEPTMKYPYNPNGSDGAVEGILSPDGRVFGKMGHSERAGEFLMKNVPGNYDQKIFEAGVRYFL